MSTAVMSTTVVSSEVVMRTVIDPTAMMAANINIMSHQRHIGSVMFGGFQLMHKYTLFVRNAATAASDNSEHPDKQHYPDKSWDKVEDACPPVKLYLL